MMPQNAQKQVTAVERTTAVQPTIRRAVGADPRVCPRLNRWVHRLRRVRICICQSPI
jgi:hypothetical protein